MCHDYRPSRGIKLNKTVIDLLSCCHNWYVGQKHDVAQRKHLLHVVIPGSTCLSMACYIDQWHGWPLAGRGGRGYLVLIAYADCTRWARTA